MPFTKITETDLQNKGVIGLPDTPGLSTTEMQEKFDEIALDVLAPKHNVLVDELEATTGASNIGALNSGGTASNIQTELDNRYPISTVTQLLNNKVDKEEGKSLSTNDFSAGYKYKLDNIEDNANNYVLPKGSQTSLGGVMGDGSTFTIDENGYGHAIGGGGGGTSDFNALINKPVYNGKTFMGDHDSEYYGVLRPYLVVTSEVGSTITISKGGETITATQKSGSTTQWEVYPTSYGTWTVSSDLPGADIASTTIVIDAVKTYAITVEHITATITVTYQAGATCVCKKGTTEYVATSNPQTFTVRSIGTWTIETVYDGITKSVSVPITTDGQTESVTIEYATIEVTYGNAFRGTTITCASGATVYSKTAPSSGNTLSFTIASTGTWVVTGEVSGTPYTRTQEVTEMTTYPVTLNVFNATVTVTFPYSEGASCTITDGVTTLTANTSPMAFNVPNVGTWTATCTIDNVSAPTQSAVITTDGQTETMTFTFGTINLTYDNAFRGLTVKCASSGTTISKTAPISGNTMAFYPPSTGNWTVSGVYSGQTYVSSPNPVVVSSLATPVSANLQTNIQVNVTLHGANGAVIEFYDLRGTLQQHTLGDSGTKANVSVVVAPNSPYVTFVDTSISKIPTNLTEEYFRRYEITSATTDIYVTPDNALYWYGYQDNLETCNTTNGWSTGGSQWSYTDPTYNANSITLSSVGTNKYAFVGSHTTVPCTKIKKIVQGNAVVNTKTYYGYSVLTTKDLYNSNIDADNVTSSSVTYYENTASDQEKYLAVGTYGNGVMTLSGLWYDTATTPTTPTYYSAACDVLYIKDSSNNVIPIAYTDEEGKCYDAISLPSGTYTIYSSVAKNPDDLTADYSKSITITNATTEVKVMPDNSLYWWGYESDDIQDISSANGWSSTWSVLAPTHNKNDITVSASSSKVSGIGTKTTHSGTFKAILQGVSAYNNVYGYFCNNSSKSVDQGSEQQITSSSVQLVTKSGISNSYMYSYVGNSTSTTQSIKYMAMWYE